jgi:hypothetical protein
MLALDWTSYADDNHWMLSLNILTAKGSSTPLLWKTVSKERLKHNRARYEDELLSRLKEVIPKDVKITLVADRGFCDHKFLRYLEEELKISYIIRIKSNTTITTKEGEKKKVSDWLSDKGKLICIKDAKITLQEHPISQVVCVKDIGMKEAWHLVTNINNITPRTVINYYAKRWKIEPYFRDIKDARFGFGLNTTHIKSTERRDRLFLIVALSYVLLILLGQAGESLGLDKLLKVNTVKTRTHSLYRQGLFYFEFLPNFNIERQTLLLNKFNAILEKHDFWLTAFNH